MRCAKKTRDAVIALLPGTVRKMSDELGVSTSTVKTHLMILIQEGMVESRARVRRPNVRAAEYFLSGTQQAGPSVVLQASMNLSTAFPGCWHERVNEVLVNDTGTKYYMGSPRKPEDDS